jgi:UDP-GlcNAc:undecaprenyl-phosphate/decaprenyl-phosphate GlcNAc-1-phosphate transferase
VRHAAELTGTVAATVATAAVAARAAYTALRRKPPAGEPTWTRTNHRGEPVTLLEGPAVAVGAITAEVVTAALAGRLTGRRRATATHDPERSRGSGSPLAVSLAGAGALGFGVLDDLKGSGKRRGLRGHLGALAHGEVTTGTIKLAGLAATGLVVSANELRARPSDRLATDLLINAGLIAGGANLLNLFDLRPGRAIKVAALSAGLIAGGSAAGGSGAGAAAVAAPIGAGLALLPEDLAERAMLGDAGANALGAMLGAAAATSLPRTARAVMLAGIVALTVASEKVSFTKVIERTPALHWLDMLGRVEVFPPGGTTPPLTPSRMGGLPVPASPAGPPANEAHTRRPGGKHRRVRDEGTSVRSAVWVFGFLKPVFGKQLARQEP